MARYRIGGSYPAGHSVKWACSMPAQMAEAIKGLAAQLGVSQAVFLDRALLAWAMGLDSVEIVTEAGVCELIRANGRFYPTLGSAPLPGETCDVTLLETGQTLRLTPITDLCCRLEPVWSAPREA